MLSYRSLSTELWREIVERLNEAKVPTPGGKPWTAELFKQEMKRLGA